MIYVPPQHHLARNATGLAAGVSNPLVRVAEYKPVNDIDEL